MSAFEENHEPYNVNDPDNCTWYHKDTPRAVCQILESHLQHNRNKRLRLFLGDSVTGRDWGEEWDVLGYVGRSTGWRKIPLLVHNSRSMGGGGILDNCIIKIMTTGGSVLWQHENYNRPSYEVKESDESLCKKGYVASVFGDGSLVASFKSFSKAKNWIDFMTGKRMSK